MFTLQTTPNKSPAEPALSKPANAKPPDIASASVSDTLASLHVIPKTGLTHAEVDVRRKEHGYNEVAEKKAHPVLIFLGADARRICLCHGRAPRRERRREGRDDQMARSYGGSLKASMHSNLFLVRYEETAWSISGQHTGRAQIPLTNQGEQNA